MTPADAEIAVGIECYVTGGPPCNARAKTSDEDFFVRESIALDEVVHQERPDYFPLYKVEKRSIDTMHMARELSAALKSRVSYAGLKDRKAVAVQYATPTSRRAKRPPRVEHDKFTAVLVGYVPKPISRGAVLGNSFAVVLRECCDDVEARIEETAGLARSRLLPNFFGFQRFGASRGGTHLVGKKLVTGQFEEAVEQLLLSSGGSDVEVRRIIEETFDRGSYEEVADLLPPGKDIERSVARELGRHPGNWIGALRAVPLALRRFYVQAYQSLIFNRTLSRALARGEDISAIRSGDNWAPVSEDGLTTYPVRGVKDVATPEAVPMIQIVGYAFRDYGSRFDAVITRVLAEEEVSPGQFYIKEMQEASAEGGFRRPHLAVSGFSWKVAGSTATLGFTLGKGQYATMLLREIMKPRDPAASGLA